MELIIDELILYLENTKDETWCTDVVKTNDGKSCVMGHVFDFGGNKMWELFEAMIATTFMIYPVNDGEHPNYQQPTAKERCIAYLKAVKEGKEKTSYQLWEEAGNEIIAEKIDKAHR